MSTPVSPPLRPADPALSAGGDAADQTGAQPVDWEGLAEARTRTLDAREGFAKMAEHAEPEFAPTVARYFELHSRHAERLRRILEDAGVAMDAEPSLMGTVNRLVVATRAMFDEIDADVLKQIHSGEKHVLAAYEGAQDMTLPGEVHDCLSDMIAELRALLEETPRSAPA
ncbi:MAG: DUF2383 domain-containing protein [Tabrizicola sp.]|nr:DUF2383 domain-containing protein [Tabrizicola sp.]